MTATVGGFDLIAATIQEPRVGVWSAELDVDCDDVLSGEVTIEIDGVQWVGTVVRGEQNHGRLHVMVVGGAAAFHIVLDAKFYLGAKMSVVLDDLMRETGEKLATDVASEIKGYQPDRWTRIQGPGAQAMRVIADELGIAWRVQRDGSVWLGQESWDTLDVDDYDEIKRAPSHGSVTIAPGFPFVIPGVTFGGERVSMVTTRVNASGVRQELLFEDDDSDARFGRFGADFAAIVETVVGTRIDYARMYPATVVSQNSDGSLDVLADDPKVRGTGVSKVPIRHGLPGVNVEVPSDVRVLLFFEDGNPQRPAVALWPDGSSVTKIKITSEVEIVGDLNVTGEVTAKSGSPQQVTLTGHQHPSAVGPTSKALPMT